jgi:hypothetical protein
MPSLKGNFTLAHNPYHLPRTRARTQHALRIHRYCIDGSIAHDAVKSLVIRHHVLLEQAIESSSSTGPTARVLKQQHRRSPCRAGICSTFHRATTKLDTPSRTSRLGVSDVDNLGRFGH